VGFGIGVGAATEARVGADSEGTLVADLEAAARGGIEEDSVPPDGVASAPVAGASLVMIWSARCSPSDETGSSGTTVLRLRISLAAGPVR